MTLFSRFCKVGTIVPILRFPPFLTMAAWRQR
jgi:hypothetical protein